MLEITDFDKYRLTLVRSISILNILLGEKYCVKLYLRFVSQFQKLPANKAVKEGVCISCYKSAPPIHLKQNLYKYLSQDL